MSSTPRNDLFRVYSCCFYLVASNLLWMVVPMTKALVFTRKCYVTDIKWLYYMHISPEKCASKRPWGHIHDIPCISLVLNVYFNYERPSLLSCYQYISWEHRDSSFVPRSLRLPGMQFMSSWPRAKTVVIPVQNDCINLSSFESNALGKGTFKNQGTGRPSFFLERLQGGVAIGWPSSFIAQSSCTFTPNKRELPWFKQMKPWSLAKWHACSDKTMGL